MAESGEICSGDQGSCLPTFLENHPEFQYVQVPDDGDCFFHSIAAYYARTGERIDGVSDPTDPDALRIYIVENFIEIVNTDANVRNKLLINDRNSIAKLFESGVWATTSFDVMITMVPRILHINLHIYGVYHYGDGQFIITRAEYGEDARSTITLFLASNHYGLLYPIDGINRRSSAKKRANAKVITNIERKRKENAEATAKLLAKYEKQASMPKLTSITRKKKAEPLHENENMRRAMELSLQNVSFNNNIANAIRKSQQINNNAALALNIAKLNIVNKKPVNTRRKLLQEQEEMNAAIAASIHNMEEAKARQLQKQINNNAAFAANIVMEEANGKQQKQEQLNLNKILANSIQKLSVKNTKPLSPWEHNFNFNNKKYTFVPPVEIVHPNSKYKSQLMHQSAHNSVFKNFLKSTDVPSSISIIKKNVVSNKNATKKRKKPTVGVLPLARIVNSNYNSNSSNVSAASAASNVSWNNGINIENAKTEYPYKTTTVKEIKEMLNAYGIEYHPKDTKEMLYGELVLAYKSNLNHRTKNIMQREKQAAKNKEKKMLRRVTRKLH